MRSWAKYTQVIFCILQVAKCVPAQLDGGFSSADLEAPALIVEAHVKSASAENYASNELKSVTNRLDDSQLLHRTQPLDAEGDDITTETFLAPKCDNDCSSVQEANCVCDCSTGTIVRRLGNEQCANEVNYDDEITTSEPVEETTAGENLGPTTEIAKVISEANLGDDEETKASDPPTSAELITSCSSVGNFTFESDCRLYYACALAGDAQQQSLVSCPPEQAFNPEVSRCTRDISSCAEDPTCVMAGTHPHPLSNNSYYWCVSRMTGGFRKYHIQCAAGRVFVAQLDKCFIDIDNLDKLTSNYGGVDDEDIVKAELKEFKAADKARLKEQKLKAKMEKKLQKELAKKAMKDAKNEAKGKQDSYDDDD